MSRSLDYSDLLSAFETIERDSLRLFKQAKYPDVIVDNDGRNLLLELASFSSDEYRESLLTAFIECILQYGAGYPSDYHNYFHIISVFSEFAAPETNDIEALSMLAVERCEECGVDEDTAKALNGYIEEFLGATKWSPASDVLPDFKARLAAAVES